MRHLVAILGTSHHYQFGGANRSDNQNPAFNKFIKQTCHTHGIRCLAEEMSLDALRRNNQTQSTLECIAIDLGISHIYCDPSESEQSDMGLQIERDAETLRVFWGWSRRRIKEGIVAEQRFREYFWLEKLKQKATWPSLFVCGSNHVSSFRSLLQGLGF